MTDAPTDAPPQIAAVSPADPLARLHHMSTTAGITTQEYVAINVASVVTVVLGMLSLAVLLFHQLVLLVIPAAAIVFGLVALRQIRDSNGTQWGLPLAWAGIILAVLLGGADRVLGFIQGQAQENDQQQVARLISNLGERLAKNDDASAYALFTDRFRQRVTPDAFTAKWAVIRKNVGPVKAISWNGVGMRFEKDGTGTLYGMAMAKAEFGNNTPSDGRQQVNARKGDTGWQIDAIPLLFTEDRKKTGAGSALPTNGPTPAGR